MYIWVKDVDADYALATATTFNEYITDATQVYANDDFSSTEGWNTFSFASTFSHEGGKALLVAVRGVGCSTSGGCSRGCHYTSATNTWWNKHVDTSDPGQEVSGTVGNNRANIQLELNYTGSVCFPPTGLTYTNVTENAATLSWTENGESTAWTLEYGTANDFVGATTVNVSGTPTTSLSGLSALTTYYVRVKADCGSDWLTGSFTTTAVAEAVENAWSDDFEGTSCGWDLINGTITNAWAWGTATSNGGTHALYISNDGGTTNAYTNNSAAMVYATKLLNFADGKYEFTYDWIANGEGSYDYLRVALVPASVTLTAGTTLPSGFGTSSLPTGWIALDGGSKLNLVTAWQSKSVSINVTAGNYYLVMAWRDDTSSGTNPPAAVDNVSITRVACAYDVEGLAVDNVTTNSATLTWTAGEAEQWQVTFADNGNFNNATEAIVSAATYNMTGLQPSTKYYAKVRVYCGGEDFGSWSSVFDFFTDCAIIPAVGYTENFDSYTAAAGVLPICWNKINTTSNSSYQGYPRIYNYSYQSSPNCLYFYSYYSTYSDYDPQDQYAILPEMENLAGKLITLSAKANSSTVTFKIGLMTDPTDATTFTEMATQALTTSYQEFEYVVPADATAHYIAIMMEAASSSSSTRYVYIDDIAITEAPTCFKPTGLTYSNVYGHGATITWTSDAAAWQVQLNEEDPIDVEETTYTFENLDPETAYTAKVRANCDGTYSEWTTAVSFTTTIACPAPTNLTVTPNALTATFTWESNAGEWEVVYSTNANADPDEIVVGTFVNEATYTVNDLELGDYYFWVRANCGDEDGNSQWAGPVSVHIGYCVPNPSNVDGNGISNVTFGMGDNIVNNDTPKATYADYSSQIGAVQAGVESTIAITYATGYTYGTIIWVDLDNSLSFEDSEIVYTGTSESANPTTLNAAITIPATQTPGDYMMRIGGADSGFDSYISGSSTTAPSACYTGNWACFQDYTLRVLEAPSCMMPTTVAINYTGGTTATVTWQGTTETYNIDVNGTVTNDVTTPYTLENLDLATTYEVKVQANCDGDETSEWTTAVSFTTDFCLPEDMCEITLELTDDYGDGWNGNYIQVVDGETNAVLGEFTNTNEAGGGEAQTFTLPVCNGREISFVYGLGNGSSTYPYENSFVIYDVNGEIICQHELDDDGPTPGVVGTYTVNCDGVSYTLEIEGVGEDNWNNENNSGYHLIASPVNVDLTNHEMTTGDFDLYYFDQVGDEDGNEWMNYKNESFNLEPGKGYLYAHKIGGEFTLTGTAYSGDGEIELVYDENATDFQGWNLVGNPWTVTAYPDHAFYTMNEGGSGIDVTVCDAGTEVNRMTGIFVVAEGENETVTFATENPGKTVARLNLNITRNSSLIDRAIVRFSEGSQLPKFQLNPNHTKIYMSVDGKDYAIVNATEMGEMPVSFKAESDGSYTLSVNAEEVSFAYLHLIDNMTGIETDLLANPSYSFEASTTDYANRFKLVFATGNADDDFAFFSNGSFVINNEGIATVQVIDVNGRIISSESINGCANVNVKAAAGVYMIRLVNGDNVKVQKVVVK